MEADILRYIESDPFIQRFLENGQKAEAIKRAQAVCIESRKTVKRIINAHLRIREILTR